MIFKIGPFTLYRAEHDGTLDVSLTAFVDCAFGWEYGWEDPMTGRQPWFQVRLGKLMIFSFQKWKGGFEIWVLGFWWIR